MLAAVVAIADLLTKRIVFDWFDDRGMVEGEIHWIYGRFFGWARVMNPGVTGGVGSALGPTLLSLLTTVAVVAILLYLILPRGHSRFTLTGLALVLGGAVGNLYDRIVFGEVRDFIDVWPRLPWPSWLHHWPTFNIADSAIVTGVILLMFHSLFLHPKETRERNQAAARTGRSEGV